MSVEDLEPAAGDIGSYVAAAEAHIVIRREHRIVNDARMVGVWIHGVVG